MRVNGLRRCEGGCAGGFRCLACVRPLPNCDAGVEWNGAKLMNRERMKVWLRPVVAALAVTAAGAQAGH